MNKLVSRKKWIALLIAFMFVMQVVPAYAFFGGPKVKNVIVLMADGCGSTHNTVTRWYKGAPLALDEMVTGAIRTYSAESLITDSAPAATAFGAGHKSNSKFIAMLPAKTTMPGVAKISDDLKYKPIATVLEGAKLQGKSTGLVATSNIQHASPAGYSAHTHNRGDYNDIAEQQVYLNIDVVFGGGKQYLLPTSQGGKRTDGENLVDVLKSRGYEFVETRDQILKTDAAKVWGMFGADDMLYEMDRKIFRPEQPNLAEMTQKAIQLLSKNNKGFFLFVEGSKVDWASHANDPIGVISDIQAFDDAVKVALDFAKKDGQTLVLAFSDHGNGGMTIGNKSTDKTYDTLPFEALIAPLKKAKMTGEGIEMALGSDRSEANVRKVMAESYGINDLTAQEVADIQKAKKGSMNYVVGPMMSIRSCIGWTTTGHVGEDLFLYAYGPNKPVGLIENTELAHVSAKALGFELAKVDEKLFVEAGKGFAAIGAKTALDTSDKANPKLIVTKGTVRAELPVSKNIIKINNQIKELHGITVLSIKTGKVYIPQQAINLINAAAQ